MEALNLFRRRVSASMFFVALAPGPAAAISGDSPANDLSAAQPASAAASSS